MPIVLTVFLAAGAAYAGFQWTVHLVVYRQFPLVPAAAFADYEQGHQRRISMLVGPLFAALVISTGWLLIDRPVTVAGWAAATAAALVAVIIGMTAFGAVPLHRRLSVGWDPDAYRGLLRVDLVRTLAATGVAAFGVAFCVFSVS
ncbi:DUF1772 domain-containing protein [Nakamurella sp. GG22]